jgi:hypothetical protein
MDSNKSYGILDALIPGTEFHDHYQQRQRELEFYGILLEMMDCGHPHFILPENEMTKH